MSHKYFTINERNKLEVLLKKNYKISKIFKIFNRHRATIYREIDRAAIYREIMRVKGEYCAEKA